MSIIRFLSKGMAFMVEALISPIFIMLSFILIIYSFTYPFYIGLALTILILGAINFILDQKPRFIRFSNIIIFGIARKTIKIFFSHDKRGVALLSRSINSTSLLRMDNVRSLTTDEHVLTISDNRGFLDQLEDAIFTSCCLVCLLDEEFSLSDSFLGLRVRAQSDETWQKKFLEMAEMAQVIILIPGITQGILWEINIIRNNEKLRIKTLIMIPSEDIGIKGSHHEKIGFSNYDIKNLSSSSEKIWEESKKELSKQSIHLPEWMPKGAFYQPNTDLSINQLYEWNGTHGLSNSFKIALSKLDSDFPPIKQIHKDLKKMGLK